MDDAVKNVPKQRGRPFAPGVSGNPRGRPTGSRNKRSLANIQAAQSGGEMPLDFLLATMRDQTLPLERRIDAAKACAPYLHPRLANLCPRGFVVATLKCRVMGIPVAVGGLSEIDGGTGDARGLQGLQSLALRDTAEGRRAQVSDFDLKL